MARGERVGEELAERAARAWPRVEAALRRASSGRHLGSKRHHRPFGRGDLRRELGHRRGRSFRHPVMRHFLRGGLVLLFGRGTGPGERPGGGEREAGSGSRRPCEGATHDAGAGGSRGRGAGRGRSNGRGVVGCGSGCRGRRGRRTKATDFMQLLSGTGARLVMKMGGSDKAELQMARGGRSSGLRLFGGRNVYAPEASAAQISVSAGGERWRSPGRELHRSDAGVDAQAG
jgi:hypothetical protein